ncbi:MAG TPA: bifunctional UDP-N-acetylglucosamine diphosphorylase/glucosamine-1-phosphate N-acetyltransferase GlmU, partial [Candidatus Limnocylindria bacterium]|nr:bifunctional UDP-N-acetylglucosamine diphosphorylase/glucosamine-1-phosphate N-acetyltransferase GlmU [Candidatus Limnocylindria bacterium]
MITLHNIQAIVLAAGSSSRFKTGKTKLVEKICGQEMILYPTKLLHELNIPTTMVVGFQKEYVQTAVSQQLENTTFVVQESQQGTGHAIACSRSTWQEDTLLIMNGDMPLVTRDIIEQLYTHHHASNAAVSFVIAHNADPSLQGYGRVIQEDNRVLEIIEAKEFRGDPHQHCCINAGIYLVKRSFLETIIDEFKQSNISKEFYFTDIVKLANERNLPVTTTVAPFDRIRGINTFQELWIAEQIKRAELIRYWMECGVHFSAAQNVHIDVGVTIGVGTRIGCGVHLLGRTTIGSHTNIHEFSSLENSTIGDHVKVYAHCIIKDTTIDAHAQVGPFAHLHHEVHIGSETIIGNFVEMKKTTIGTQSKAKHLAYLGDATIGSHVNIGAGTITCNHNGSKKNPTTIADHAYIGTNNSLVAPVTIGNNAYTAAGSVITDDVPAYALAIGRARQVTKEGYVHTMKEAQQQQVEPAQPATDIPKLSSTP